MGNEDGFLSSIANFKKNSVVDFEDGYFSFAFGNEIAMVINDNYYILNCDVNLWKEVCEKVDKTKDKSELIKFWVNKSKKYGKSKKYEINDWSNDFKNLRNKD